MPINVQNVHRSLDHDHWHHSLRHCASTVGPVPSPYPVFISAAVALAPRSCDSPPSAFGGGRGWARISSMVVPMLLSVTHFSAMFAVATYSGLRARIRMNSRGGKRDAGLVRAWLSVRGFMETPGTLLTVTGSSVEVKCRSGQCRSGLSPPDHGGHCRCPVAPLPRLPPSKPASCIPCKCDGNADQFHCIERHIDFLLLIRIALARRQRKDSRSRASPGR